MMGIAEQLVEMPQEEGVKDITNEYLLPILTGGISLTRGLPPISEFLLSYAQPIYKFFDESLNSFGKVGKQYYKENLQPYKDYNSVLDDYVYYPGKQAGKIRYKYMNQLPKVRKGVREADTNLFIKNKKARTDADGFNNLKVNFKGEDYAYQVKNNPVNNHKEFYNIKPYNLAEKDYQEQIWSEMFEKLLEE